MTEYRASPARAPSGWPARTRRSPASTRSNIDDTADRARPAHTPLLAAGIPVIEHLTGLDLLPPTGASFTAVRLRVAGLGTITVRAFARVPEGSG